MRPRQRPGQPRHGCVHKGPRWGRKGPCAQCEAACLHAARSWRRPRPSAASYCALPAPLHPPPAPHPRLLPVTLVHARRQRQDHDCSRSAAPAAARHEGPGPGGCLPGPHQALGGTGGLQKHPVRGGGGLLAVCCAPAMQAALLGGVACCAGHVPPAALPPVSGAELAHPRHSPRPLPPVRAAAMRGAAVQARLQDHQVISLGEATIARIQAHVCRGAAPRSLPPASHLLDTPPTLAPTADARHRFYGSREQLGYWRFSEADWREHWGERDVIVVTPDVLLHILAHGYRRVGWRARGLVSNLFSCCRTRSRLRRGGASAKGVCEGLPPFLGPQPRPPLSPRLAHLPSPLFGPRGARCSCPASASSSWMKHTTAPVGLAAPLPRLRVPAFAEGYQAWVAGVGRTHRHQACHGAGAAPPPTRPPITSAAPAPPPPPGGGAPLCFADNHPYAVLLQDYVSPLPPRQRPHVLAMTASPQARALSACGGAMRLAPGGEVGGLCLLATMAPPRLPAGGATSTTQHRRPPGRRCWACPARGAAAAPAWACRPPWAACC